MKTDITVLLDRSGSMQSIKTDMEGGFKKFLEEQRKIDGECTITLIQFDDRYEHVYTKLVADSPELILEPRGMTALYDGLGRAINDTGERLRKAPNDSRRVLFMVITDGGENASKEFTQERVRNMVEHQKSKYSWDFMYLGANQDAWGVGTGLGIQVNSTYQATKAGIRNTWATASANIRSYRGGELLQMPKDIK